MISLAHASEQAAEHAASSGLPQFDSSTFSSQIFWTVVSFAVLLYLLKRFVIPPINDILDARGKDIANDLEQAKKTRKEAEAALAKYRQEMTAARQEASKIMEQTREEAARRREAAMRDLDQDLTKRKNSAMEEIEQAKRAAVGEVREMAVEVAMSVAERLIGKAVTKTDANKMVEEALSQLSEGKDKAVH